MLRAVIFDLDGVIVDTMDMHFEAAEQVLNEAGAGVTKEKLERFDTMRSKDAFAKILPGKSGRQIEGLVDEKYRRLSEMARGIKPYKGFSVFFAGVFAKYPIAVVSSSVRSFVESVLAGVGIRGKVAVVLGGDDVQKGKPDPEGYFTAAKMLGVKPQECLVVEDSLYGIMSAKAAGMKVIAVTNTYERGMLLDADLVVDSLAELTVEKCESLFHSKPAALGRH